MTIAILCKIQGIVWIQGFALHKSVKPSLGGFTDVNNFFRAIFRFVGTFMALEGF